MVSSQHMLVADDYNLSLCDNSMTADRYTLHLEVEGTVDKAEDLNTEPLIKWGRVIWIHTKTVLRIL